MYWWTMALAVCFVGVGGAVVMLARRLASARCALRLSDSRYRTIVTQMADGILLVDAHTGRVIEANAALLRRLGYTAAEIATLELEDVLVEVMPTAAAAELHGLEHFTNTTRTHARTLKQRCKNGRLLDVEVTASELEVSGRKALCYIAHDVTERKHIELELLRNQRRLEHLAHHDSLTGLPNRLFLRTYLDEALRSCAANDTMAVLFLDLDNFKVINDTRGHNIGDELLIEIARQVKKLIGTRGVVARLGGDEFLVVLRNVASKEAVVAEAKAVLDALSGPLRVAGRLISTSVSIGATLCPRDARDTDSVLRNADLAMYRAKESGRGNLQFFAPEMKTQVRRRVTMEQALRRALKTQQLIVHYHPLVDIATRRIVSLEALVRWEHPQLGMIPPGKFITIAEDSGLIVPIGEHVLRTACEQTVAWQRAGVPVVPVAVNWSAIQLQRQDVVATVQRVLQEMQMQPRMLSLELTEGTFMRDARQHGAALQALRSQGVRIQIDDFGTGYSSLSYLRELPIDVLKIDRSFIDHVADSPADQAIVRAILAMAGSLGLHVVAEGVETAMQLEMLCGYGCEIAQGFYFSRPLPPVQCRALLEELAMRPSFTETLRLRMRREEPQRQLVKN